MKFKAGTRRKAIEYENDLVKYWKENQTFEKSIAGRPADNAYVFYDGPPFITGVPHHGTLLTSVVKDAVPRYWTMKGKRVERRWGWDCHGLPAEVFTEKKLGITDKREIGTKISLALLEPCWINKFLALKLDQILFLKRSFCGAKNSSQIALLKNPVLTASSISFVGS